MSTTVTVLEKGKKQGSDLKAREEALQQALKTNSPTAIAVAYLELGNTFYKTNPRIYFENSKDCFSKVITLSVSADIKAEALMKRAELYETVGSLKEAMEDYEQACKFENDISNNELKGKVFFQYAQALITQEKYKEAVEPLRRARKYRPASDRTISLLVTALNEGKRPQNIFECLQAANLSLEEINAYAKQQKWLPIWLEAARLGAVNIVEGLAIIPGVETGICDESGNSALHLAAIGGHVDLIEPLSRYIDYNMTNKEGYTPILLAAKMGRVAMVQALLAKGARPFVHTDVLKAHVLTIAITENQGCLLESLLSDKVYRKFLFEGVEIGALFLKAIETKSLIMLSILIHFFPKEMDELYLGQTALQYAIVVDFKEAVYLLVEKGAKLETQNKEGKTALMLAEELKSFATNFLRNYASELKTQEEVRVAKSNRNRKEVFDEVLQQLQKRLPKLFEKTENINRFSEVLEEVFNTEVGNKIFLNSPDVLNKFSTLLLEAILKKENDIIESKPLSRSSTLVSWIPVPFSGTKTPSTSPSAPPEFNALIVDQTQLSKILLEFLNSNWEAELVKEPIIVEMSAVKTGRLTLSQNQVAFCLRFEAQFDDAFSYFKGLASGELVSAKDMKDRQKASVVTGAMYALRTEIATPTFGLPIPSVSLPAAALVVGAVELMLYLRHRYQKKEAERMILLFKNVSPSERTYFIRYTAEQLAYKYELQINHLFPGSGGVEQFADCAAARIIEYITSDERHIIASQPGMISNMIRVVQSWALNKEIPTAQANQKSLYDIFLDGIIRVKSSFPKDLERLQTINTLTLTDNWNSKIIFENTGIVTELGERFAHKNCLIDKVGYCRGTKEEAERRNLNLCPTKGQFWGEGRIWETVRDQVLIGPTPQTHVSSQPLGLDQSKTFDPLRKAQTAAQKALSFSTSTVDIGTSRVEVKEGKRKS